ncbi:MAG: hypothetical protein ACFFBD_27095, partial [Candidatus Hodarchaeota archaeon]
PELIIHLSGGFSTYFFRLLRHDEEYHNKTYILTDLDPVLQINKQVQERFYEDMRNKFSGELPKILNLKYDILADNLVEILNEQGIDPRKTRPLIILEGVLNYFKKSTQIRLLNQLIEILAPLNGFLIVDVQSEFLPSIFQAGGIRGRISRKIGEAFLESTEAVFSQIKEHELLNLGFQVINSGILDSISFVQNLNAPMLKPGSCNVLLLSFSKDMIPKEVLSRRYVVDLF